MLGILLILFIAIYLVFLFPIRTEKSAEVEDTKYSVQLKKLWSIAQTAMRERKPLRAEKALLTILKFDEKNAAAYNRLGILYAKAQKYDEAIECFEIAQSLDNNASSLHNAGLIYLETGAYEKASMAFQQALKLEGDLPARHIALAKAEEKLGRRKSALESLETAFELAPTTATLRQILAIHEDAGDTEAIAATTARIEEQLAAEAKARAAKRKIREPRTTITTRAKQKKPAPRILYPKSRATKTPPKTATTPAKTKRRPAASPAKATSAFPRTRVGRSTRPSLSTTRRTTHTAPTVSTKPKARSTTIKRNKTI